MNSTDDMIEKSREEILIEELFNRSLPRKITECTFGTALIITAFTGNLLVWLAITRNKKLQTLPNYYIASLAFTDILMSLCGMPLTLVTLIADDWICGVVLCQYQAYVGTVFGTSSLLNITLTAINRYFKIVRAKDYHRYFTTKTVLSSITASWVSALVVPALYLGIGDRFRFHPGKAMCFYDLDNSNIIYAVSTITGFAVLPFMVITVCYYKVFRTVTRHNKNLAQSAQAGVGKFAVDEVRLAKLLFAILLGFVACWTPFVTIDVIGAIKGQFSLPRGAYLVYTVAAGLSSCINPVIYGVMNKEFRSEINKMLKTFKLCLGWKKLPQKKYVVGSSNKSAMREHVSTLTGHLLTNENKVQLTAFNITTTV